MTGTSTRRRQSPAVYRRRRLVVLVGLLVVVAVVWLMIAQPWRAWGTPDAAPPPAAKTQDAATELPVPDSGASQDPAGTTETGDTAGDTATGGDAATGTPAVDAPVAPPGVEPCIARNLSVEALTDQDTYGTGQNPQLSIRLTNTGEVDCTLNVGTSSQVFTITSGDDVWWRSTDCQTEPSDMIVLLAAGQAVSSAAPLTWDRTRSAVGTCTDPDRPHAPGGGASYHLSVEIGGIASTQTAQLLLY